jgi:hypothetical protein
MTSTRTGGTNHIEVHGLRRVYGTGPGAFEAVRGIDLVVEAGAIVALLGTNGAGKTSALEVVEGLAPPTAGEVRVLGLDPVAERAEVRRRALSAMPWPNSTWPPAPPSVSVASRAASYGGWTWLARCLVILRSCSSTSQPPGSIPRAGAGSGDLLPTCGTAAVRCC